MATLYHPMPVAGMEFKSNTTTGGSVPATYDVFLYKPLNDPLAPMKLTIKLRINLRPLTPSPLPLHRDADGNPFWTIPWSATDWMNFINGAIAQANVWNNKLWLVAPDSFTEYGYSNPSSFPGQTWRPHVRCELDVDFAANTGAHKTIDVANLNLAMLAGAPKNSGSFRSHALLYDSLDTVPMVVPWATAPGAAPTRQLTIAHEIGHAIGLHHIGVIKKTPLCEIAQSLESMGMDQTWQVQGGKNSFYCYGHSQGQALAGNIMGGGNNFSPECGLPWLWAMKSLRGKIWEDWKAVTTDPGAGGWVKAA